MPSGGHARHTLRLLLQLGFVVLLLLRVSACRTADPTPADDPEAAIQARSRAQMRALRQQLRDDFPGLYAAFLQAGTVGTPIATVLAQEELPLALRRRVFLYRLYRDRGFQPALWQGDAWGPQVDPLLTTLQQADRHALPVARFWDDTLRQTLRAQAEFYDVVRRMGPLHLRRADLQQIEALLDHHALRLAQEPLSVLFQLLFPADPDASPLPELAQAHHARLRAHRAAAAATALADVLLTDRLLEYAWEQRHSNTSWIDEEMTAEAREAFTAQAMTNTFDALAAATTADQARVLLDTLPPQHPQYQRLLPHLPRYRAIVAQGGWNPVQAVTLRRGHRHARVAELKDRLRIEGYYDGPTDEVFDQVLDTAVRLYQATHQMDVTGETDRDFFASLNIPADQRLAQLELTMQRWRESRIGEDTYYIHVNIPDFHAEIWRDGEVQYRWKVVVGNTQRTCDPATRTWRYANATPLQSARMTYLVLNPYWNIPRRILEEELLPNLLRSADYFERQGIEQVQLNGSTVVRQRPGPTNPLGRVKFIFPNPHDTYMHDTSRPHYFGFPVRAFSHGCMRVENPMTLAEVLLTNDGQWDAREIERIMARGTEEGRRLRTPVPVHIEYYVVRADEEGQLHFLADIYRYDRDRLQPPDRESLRCDPERGARPVRRLVVGEDGRPRVRDAEGNLIEPGQLGRDRAPSRGGGGGAGAGVTAGDIGP
jgi:murein L,D-transpeptidase YcbB/YkuD